ncbi:galactoside O-acetyltransferase [Rhodoblastus sphagnicola]|uniref:Galactoside O-acetyltransferase n=1 Tax=Rhodoblastus sphagnicola TaxID=333368 RepID=A0A2S6NAN7_9HYPH|nr:galactoside O-acetyltransferase [Rhodoblastus sphagnicola]MBB4200280.1 galactoside O-acetyltransferase [Rhodoblastus sphagnicola]PPQ31688.1 galactoside O-acetyltransferase [Rhodoblastus sphagnicola]
MSYYDAHELAQLGFAAIGKDVKISRLASIYGASRIAIGDHSRIDDFCVLSAGTDGILIGRHVHVAVMCAIMGAAEIRLDDYSGLSSRVSVYSSTDDYSGSAMTNPTVPAEYLNVMSQPVLIGRHVIVGAGSVILPGAILHEGAALGSLSLARGELEGFAIHAGTPARRIAERKRNFLAMAASFERDAET